MPGLLLELRGTLNNRLPKYIRACRIMPYDYAHCAVMNSMNWSTTTRRCSVYTYEAGQRAVHWETVAKSSILQYRDHAVLMSDDVGC